MDGPCWVIEDVEAKDESEEEIPYEQFIHHRCWEIEGVETKDESVYSFALVEPFRVKYGFADRLKLTWAKLARTRRGKVAKMRRETLHSTMKATMNEVRREFMNIKRELQEESLSNRYELEDYNPQQEMGSKKDLYSEVLSLDNASEINNELEKDEKSNDYEIDSYNPALEGLNG
ncbi:hypothetical protein SADUNF_Sadunf18G0049400 [Salix dunnii]|uniref:Uncharacterized protein n=1 Tax=Salix dunnii TaxID=1413687 RepID=A0A835J3B6_9ROSI|nr:hypothetical protein SADUNF_Sadunf18G0049400 [Salix dunnii]